MEILPAKQNSCYVHFSYFWLPYTTNKSTIVQQAIACQFVHLHITAVGLTYLLVIWGLSTRAISKGKCGWLPWKRRMTSAHLINVRTSASKRLNLCTPKRRGLYAPYNLSQVT